MENAWNEVSRMGVIIWNDQMYNPQYFVIFNIKITKVDLYDVFNFQIYFFIFTFIKIFRTLKIHVW